MKVSSVFRILIADDQPDLLIMDLNYTRDTKSDRAFCSRNLVNALYHKNGVTLEMPLMRLPIGVNRRR